MLYNSSLLIHTRAMGIYLRDRVVGLVVWVCTCVCLQILSFFTLTELTDIVFRQQHSNLSLLLLLPF